MGGVCYNRGLLLGFPGDSVGKESACNARDVGSVPGLERFLGERSGYPYSDVLAWRIPWTEKPVGYRPWGHKESDMTHYDFHYEKKRNEFFC